MTARYAIYLSPEPASLLDLKTASWLGRDLGGRPCPRPAIPGLSADRLATLTADPAKYGFHATLKAPFALPDGTTEAQLRDAASAFAATRRTFSSPPLTVAALGSFLALVPSEDSPELEALADDCVRAFDRFRAPPSAEELARRRANGLSDRQDSLLQEWGYPYVMEEFRFHMTLTGRIADEDERAVLKDRLHAWLSDALTAPLDVSAIAIYRQPDRDSLFVLLDRFPFGRGIIARRGR